MLKVAVIGVMGALLALLLKGEKAGQSLWIVLASCLLIMGISVAKLSDILTMIRDVEEALGSGALYLQVLLKTPRSLPILPDKIKMNSKS